MNEEIANIKNVLKNVKGEMENKELIMKEVMEDKVESESLMEEIRYVCTTLFLLFCFVLWLWVMRGIDGKDICMWKDMGRRAGLWLYLKMAPGIFGGIYYSPFLFT